MAWPTWHKRWTPSLPIQLHDYQFINNEYLVENLISNWVSPLCPTAPGRGPFLLLLTVPDAQSLRQLDICREENHNLLLGEKDDPSSGQQNKGGTRVCSLVWLLLPHCFSKLFAPFMHFTDFQTTSLPVTPMRGPLYNTDGNVNK